MCRSRRRRKSVAMMIRCCCWRSWSSGRFGASRPGPGAPFGGARDPNRGFAAVRRGGGSAWRAEFCCPLRGLPWRTLTTMSGFEPPELKSSPAAAAGRDRPQARHSDSSAVATPIGPATHLALSKMCPTCQGRFPANFRVCPQDASVLTEAPSEQPDPLIGATLAGSYQIAQLIGEGGMGRVYEARHTRLPNKRFAIKVLLEEFARQPEVVARFEQEAEAASAIAHPNIVSVFDVSRLPDGRPYIVSEYLEGQEFGALLERVGRLQPEVAVRIVRQVCVALEAAHAGGVIHRDMKPENVFLIGDPTAPLVKVLDFGISKREDSRANLTRTGMVMGTPSYMAPEQARGEKVDRSADIYAVGAILYHALTGRPPFDGEDGAAVLSQVMLGEPPNPRKVNPDIPETLELVIQHAMERKPAARYRNMLELEADLAELDPHGPLPRASSTLITPASMHAADPVSTSDSTRAGPRMALTLRATQTARIVRSARPLVVLYSALAYLWVSSGLIVFAVDVIRRVGGAGQAVTGKEVLILVIGMLLASATPMVMWVRFLRQHVWRNTPRCLRLRSILGVALVASLFTFGLVSLVVLLVEGAVLRLPLGKSIGGWGGLAVLPSLVSGLVAGALRTRATGPVPR